jgi:hypothetical protein
MKWMHQLSSQHQNLNIWSLKYIIWSVNETWVAWKSRDLPYLTRIQRKTLFLKFNWQSWWPPSLKKEKDYHWQLQKKITIHCIRVCREGDKDLHKSYIGKNCHCATVNQLFLSFQLELRSEFLCYMPVLHYVLYVCVCVGGGGGGVGGWKIIISHPG